MSLQFGSGGKRSSAEHVDSSLLWEYRTLVTAQDVACEIQLPLVTRNPIKFNQSHLDFGMSGNDQLFGCGPIVGQEKIVNEPYARIQQCSITCAAVVCDGSLQHVADVVEFMSGRLCFGQHAQGRAVLYVVSIEVSARLLRCNHVVDDSLRRTPKIGQFLGLQCESNCYRPLVNIRVGEHRANLIRAALSG